jgi:hypothetical protein
MAKKTEIDKVKAAAEKPQMSTPPIDADWDFEKWDRASSEIWKPAEGEYLLGTYESSTMLPEELKKGDKDYDVLIHFIIDKETGNRISFVGGQMCDKFIAESAIGKGTRVFIRYMGKGETRDGNPVNNWDIRYQQG